MIGYKILGSICVISACVLAGFLQSLKFQRYVTQLQDLYHILFMIRGELAYTRAPLSEIFGVIKTRVQEPYNFWMSSMQRDIEEKGGDAFPIIWRRNLKNELQNLELKGPHKKLLLEFGNVLGQLDYETGLGTIEWYLDELKSEIIKERKELVTKKKLCNYLGFMAGLFFVIVLI